MSRLFVLAIVCAGMALATPARADRAPGRLAVAGKVGVVLPQVATELDTAVGGELEGDFLLIGRLTTYLAFGYTQPTVTRTSQMDPRLPAAFDGTQTQRELTIGGGAFYRFARPEAAWNAYGGGGVRLYLLETVTVGDAGGSEFGENTEQSSHVGGVLFAGGERRLGPGALMAELQFGMSNLPHLITGDVSTAALAFVVGYRLFF